jgi:hypothetical protein
MNEKTLRKLAAELARDCRSIDKQGNWSIRDWNNRVRRTYRNYMTSTRTFHRVHDSWEGA